MDSNKDLALKDIARALDLSVPYNIANGHIIYLMGYPIALGISINENQEHQTEIWYELDNIEKVEVICCDNFSLDNYWYNFDEACWYKVKDNEDAEKCECYKINSEVGSTDIQTDTQIPIIKEELENLIKSYSK